MPRRGGRGGRGGSASDRMYLRMYQGCEEALKKADALMQDGEFQQANTLLQRALDTFCADPTKDGNILLFASKLYRCRGGLRMKMGEVCICLQGPNVSTSQVRS